MRRRRGAQEVSVNESRAYDVMVSAIWPALLILPTALVREEKRATAMLLAIALQESRCIHRQQFQGPARGFWQFEVNGVRGVLAHPQSRQGALLLLQRLSYRVTLPPESIHARCEDNDVLAAGLARLLLWTVPDPLPTEDEHELGWLQYLDAWRPGRPHRETWNEAWEIAWRVAR
jgi:hypothetical protein